MKGPYWYWYALVARLRGLPMMYWDRKHQDWYDALPVEKKKMVKNTLILMRNYLTARFGVGAMNIRWYDNGLLKVETKHGNVCGINSTGITNRARVFTLK